MQASESYSVKFDSANTESGASVKYTANKAIQLAKK